MKGSLCTRLQAGHLKNTHVLKPEQYKVIQRQYKGAADLKGKVYAVCSPLRIDSCSVLVVDI